MAYSIDVLITYAEADNQPATQNSEGWVDKFKVFLELMLEQVLGKKPNILLKSENDTLSGADFSDVAIFMPVLSDSFLASTFCLKTLDEYIKHLEKSKNQRLFKVLKTPVAIEDQPETLRNLLGYELYQMDLNTGRAGEFKDYFNTEATSHYWMHIIDIAFDIHDTLMINEGKSTGVKAINSTRTIYLAETGTDLTVQRKIIKRELQRHGFKVFPDQNLPRNASDIEETIKKHLDRCNVSIHLIGSTYGAIPEGGDKSIVDMQTRLAANKAAELPPFEFTRLIWITPNLRNAHEKQLTFIENVKRDSEVSEGAEILQTPLEDFKNIIREEVIEGGLEKKQAASHLEDKTNGQPAIYLIHDKVDQKEATGVASILEKSGYNVLFPSFKGNLLDIRENHITNLRRLDGAVIYQGEVNRQWVKMKALDLMKAPGFGRKKPILGKALISPEGQDNSLFKEKGITIIQNDKDMSKSLGSFLEEIKNG
ncbi:MAG: DUF4062 domain-containing protein [Cyclobacteriaceae bacterium]|nr:DUF4062 domain-containing protein [Cyclobacteriaceae bacterium]